ncbi:hypothetical protein Cgig2_020486 [Carnegiea gigantea]|uniref:Uncharacterized protein n=1 Tax=Carnegiea gigantea TaxID=171969 RepID=A0A9Q1KCF9_9CARY|nr:hypothetical protein Cgig2_020486 [Carnegiea gigantea]
MDDIHVNISDGGSEGEDTEMEMEEEEEEPELDLEPEQQEVLQKKIKTEHKKQRSTSAAKPPQPSFVHGQISNRETHPTQIQTLIHKQSKIEGETSQLIEEEAEDTGMTATSVESATAAVREEKKKPNDATSSRSRRNPETPMVFSDARRIWIMQGEEEEISHVRDTRS